jgi:hypothetical protein
MYVCMYSSSAIVVAQVYQFGLGRYKGLPQTTHAAYIRGAPDESWTLLLGIFETVTALESMLSNGSSVATAASATTTHVQPD